MCRSELLGAERGVEGHDPQNEQEPGEVYVGECGQFLLSFLIFLGISIVNYVLINIQYVVPLTAFTLNGLLYRFLRISGLQIQSLGPEFQTPKV